VTDVKGTPIGIVRIPDVYQVIQASPFENYFPIVTSSETRIGDLHVVFQLIKSKQLGADYQTEEKTASINNRKNGAVIPDPLHTICDSKHQDAKKTLRNPSPQPLNSAAFRSRNMQGRSLCRGRSRDVNHHLSKRHVPKTVSSVPGAFQKKTDSSAPKKKFLCEDFDDIFSQIIERGQKLQKAITMSVIEDELSGTAISDPVITLHSQSPSTPPLQTEHTGCSTKTVLPDIEQLDQHDSSKNKCIPQEDKNKVICYLQGNLLLS